MSYANLDVLWCSSLAWGGVEKKTDSCSLCGDGGGISGRRGRGTLLPAE
jgi:hypothetical protein